MKLLASEGERRNMAQASACANFTEQCVRSQADACAMESQLPTNCIFHF